MPGIETTYSNKYPRIGTFTVDIQVALYGPAGGALPMTTSLAASLLPLTEPYEGLGYLRVGFWGETIANQAVFTGNNITDWILVELRDKDNPSIVRYNRAGLLRNDGQIMDVDGVTNLTFTGIVEDTYFIAIKHRNHLGVMSNAAVDPSTAIDFTDTTYIPWGTDTRFDNSGTRSLLPGHFNQVGFIGYESARRMILDFLDQSTSAVVSGVYSIYDLNMNSQVRYGGPANDSAIISTGGLGGDTTSIVIEQIPYIHTEMELLGGDTVNQVDDDKALQKITARYSPRDYEEKYYGSTSLVLPAGTTAEEPAMPDSDLTGAIRFDTDTGKFRGCDGTSWFDLH